MLITEFKRESISGRRQLAQLLATTWPQSYGENPDQEVDNLLADDRLAIAALEGDELIGFVGAIPQYGKTGWELHPMVVNSLHRQQRIGARLLNFLEKEIISEGGLTIYLGTDDEDGSTSLSQEDLYQDTWQKIATIKNLKNHPYEFYQKQGYQIIGVIPDANGWGKPDIMMAKRVGTPDAE